VQQRCGIVGWWEDVVERGRELPQSLGDVDLTLWFHERERELWQFLRGGCAAGGGVLQSPGPQGGMTQLAVMRTSRATGADDGSAATARRWRPVVRC
jgi:hypothetical protein